MIQHMINCGWGGGLYVSSTLEKLIQPFVSQIKMGFSVSPNLVMKLGFGRLLVHIYSCKCDTCVAAWLWTCDFRKFGSTHIKIKPNKYSTRKNTHLSGNLIFR